MHYYIDGYNLLFRIIDDERDLKEQREGLIVDLEEKLRELGISATLVFDAAYQEETLTRSHFHQLEIIYTSFGESADECILSHIAHAKNPKQIILVTSDKHLSRQGRELGAQTEPTERFYQKLETRNRTKKKKPLKKVSKPIKKSDQTIQETPEEDFEFYLRTFESHVRSFVTPIAKNRIAPSLLTDFERWQSIFEKNLEKDSDG